METGDEQTIVSNRIHPYFAQVPEGEIVPPASEGFDYEGPLARGHWIDAGNLKAGYRLLNPDGSWAEVVSVAERPTALDAWNLTVEDTHSYFVASQEGADPVWVHNSCGWLKPGYKVEKLQHGYAHASDFGVSGNWNSVNGKAYQDALEAFKGASTTKSKTGTYRGTTSGTHYYDDSSGLWSFYDDTGSYVAGWRLGRDQYENLLRSGNIQ